MPRRKPKTRQPLSRTNPMEAKRTVAQALMHSRKTILTPQSTPRTERILSRTFETRAVTLILTNSPALIDAINLEKNSTANA